MDSPQIKTINVNAGFGRHGMPPPTSNPDLWPFDLETDMRVASEVGNLPSNFGHARPSGSRISRYVRDGRTDRQTDGRTKATLIAPSLRSGHNDVSKLTYNVSSEPLNPTKDYTAILFKYPRWLGVNWSAYILAKYRTQQTLICCKNPTRSTMLTAWRRRRNPVSCTSWVPN